LIKKVAKPVLVAVEREGARKQAIRMGSRITRRPLAAHQPILPPKVPASP
jgi:hypothetical protein